ncbi:MAG: hypothetical protein GTO40_13000 [Deltaproteobacteria bacterium]|nr:hypothetical protein [Deltaproteobacteria bacterium]
MKKLYFVVLFVTLIFFPSAVGSYEGVEVRDGGTIRGVVKIEGKVRQLPPPEIVKFQEVCQGVPNETLVIGFEAGIRYAVVTLEGVTRGMPVEREAINELDNRECRFVPRVQAASVGQWLVVKNSDPILHTAHAHFSGGQPDFNLGLYPGKTSRKPLVSPGVVPIDCDVHPWMKAYIVVTEHPYHAVTDILGEYQIMNIPPGSYRLKVWHETLGTQEKPVLIRSGEVTEVDFTMRAKQGVRK